MASSNSTTVSVMTIILTPSASECPHVEPIMKLREAMESLASEDEKHEEARCVICMQDVREALVGPLHAFFQQKGYHFVAYPSSNSKANENDCSGVGVAFPSDRFALIEANILNLLSGRNCQLSLMPKESVSYRPC
jgi:hypothetical protein